MAGTLTWQSDGRCIVGDLTFQTLPADLLDQDEPTMSTAGADFLLFKHRATVERYAEVLEELGPMHIFELGILEGGSTALLRELAQPCVIAAVDRRPPLNPALRDYVSRRQLDDVIRIHTDVDQADRSHLAKIAEEAFGDEPLDLVVDDCSHRYEATRASFNELFPRLRLGGVYAIEDWDWTRYKRIAEMWADQVPLTRLILEIMLVLASSSNLISEVAVADGLVQVKRGNAKIDSRGFDILDFLDASGRRLLARDERLKDSNTAPSGS
jgi:predicted O-methyltransferase YrrM